MTYCPCPIVRDVMRSAMCGLTNGRQLAEKLCQRAVLGKAKYGVTLAEAVLPKADLARHFIEEMLDGANYARAIGNDAKMRFCLGLADDVQSYLNLLEEKGKL
jgi:hypothetical protein